MKEVPLTQGKVALVDDEDYEHLALFNWYCHSGYAARMMPRGRRRPARVFMHHVLLPTPSGMFIDHANGNRLDNRRCNLRLATKAENNRNVQRKRNNRSGYKGVWWRVRYQKWEAGIRVNGRLKFLGYFDAPDIAARAYDQAARRLFGEFAMTNFPVEIA